MDRGHTLVEAMIAVTLVTGIVLVGTMTSSTITDTSNYGRHKLQVQAENQAALYFIANDLQNSSSDSDPVTNVPRFEVLDDDLVVELKTRTAESLANGDLSDTEPGVTSSGTQSGSSQTDPTGSTQTATDPTGGETGLLGGSGNTALVGDTDDQPDENGEVLEIRPRLVRVKANSRFTFRKVTGYSVDLTIGEVSPIWSSPITYSVKNRRLIREQDGQKRVIGRDVSAFKVHATPKGDFNIFLRTQKRNPTTGEVLTVSGSIEVYPKNR